MSQSPIRAPGPYDGSEPAQVRIDWPGPRPAPGRDGALQLAALCGRRADPAGESCLGRAAPLCGLKVPPSGL